MLDGLSKLVSVLCTPMWLAVQAPKLLWQVSSTLALVTLFRAPLHSISSWIWPESPGGFVRCPGSEDVWIFVEPGTVVLGESKMNNLQSLETLLRENIGRDSPLEQEVIAFGGNKLFKIRRVHLNKEMFSLWGKTLQQNGQGGNYEVCELLFIWSLRNYYSRMDRLNRSTLFFIFLRYSLGDSGLIVTAMCQGEGGPKEVSSFVVPSSIHSTEGDEEVRFVLFLTGGCNWYSSTKVNLQSFSSLEKTGEEEGTTCLVPLRWCVCSVALHSLKEEFVSISVVGELWRIVHYDKDNFNVLLQRSVSWWGPDASNLSDSEPWVMTGGYASDRQWGEQLLVLFEAKHFCQSFQAKIWNRNDAYPESIGEPLRTAIAEHVKNYR